MPPLRLNVVRGWGWGWGHGSLPSMATRAGAAGRAVAFASERISWLNRALAISGKGMRSRRSLALLDKGGVCG